MRHGTLQVILFERLGLPAGKKTATGQSSTAEDVLQELAEDYPLPRVLLEHRGPGKLKSTYTDRLPEQIHRRTGRVHDRDPIEMTTTAGST